jgi:hypothetical protein
MVVLLYSHYLLLSWAHRLSSYSSIHTAKLLPHRFDFSLFLCGNVFDFLSLSLILHVIVIYRIGLLNTDLLETSLGLFFLLVFIEDLSVVGNLFAKFNLEVFVTLLDFLLLG